MDKTLLRSLLSLSFSNAKKATEGKIGAKNMRTYTYRTIKEQQYILDNYDQMTNAEIGEKLNLKPDQVRSVYRQHGKSKSILAGEHRKRNGHFKKGHQPHNKGKHYHAGGRSVATQFKKGHVSARTRPVGATRKQTDGIIYIKVAQPQTWMSLHSHTWQQQNGAIPKGSIEVFKSGANREQFTVADLELITRAELMRRNSPKMKLTCATEQEEIIKLTTLYSNHTLKEVASEMGISEATVQGKLVKYGIRKTSRVTMAHVRFIQQNYKQLTDEEIATELGLKQPTVVYYRCKVLKLYKSNKAVAA